MLKIEEVKIIYQNNPVTAKKLTVSSEIPIDLETAWEKVKTSALLEFVAKGMVIFRPQNGLFPTIWKEGDIVKTRSLLFGFIPFGGIHTLYFEKIDNENKILQTQEYDDVAKVWNHTIIMKEIDTDIILYIDEIIIYGGFLTFFYNFMGKIFL